MRKDHIIKYFSRTGYADRRRSLYKRKESNWSGAGEGRGLSENVSVPLDDGRRKCRIWPEGTPSSARGTQGTDKKVSGISRADRF